MLRYRTLLSALILSVQDLYLSSANHRSICYALYLIDGYLLLTRILVSWLGVLFQGLRSIRLHR
jgi:hypothetical protein